MLLRPLDDLTLIYHRPSGQTHIVASPVPEILAALDGGVMDADALLTALSRDHDLGEPQAARTELQMHLTDLCALGLVRRA